MERQESKEQIFYPYHCHGEYPNAPNLLDYDHVETSISFASYVGHILSENYDGKLLLYENGTENRDTQRYFSVPSLSTTQDQGFRNAPSGV